MRMRLATLIFLAAASAVAQTASDTITVTATRTETRIAPAAARLSSTTASRSTICSAGGCRRQRAPCSCCARS